MFGRMPYMPPLALAAALAAASVAALVGPPAPRARLSAPNLPLTFEKNTGRYPKEVQFVARGGGGALFLTRREAVLSLRKGGKAAALRLKLQGSNPKAVASGLDKQPGVVSYFIGNDPKQWRANVPTYSRVKLAGVYPGIDLVYYGAGKSRTLEYDFVVRPGADASRIRMAVSGAKSLRTVGGRLVASTACGDVTLNRPYAYQTIDGKRTQVACSFTLERDTVAFQVARYDMSRPLVVDPVVEYSTYVGGSDNESTEAATSFSSGFGADASGAVYLAGTSASTDYPTTAGAYQEALNSNNDIVVSKVNSTGTALIYSTYIGSTEDDTLTAVAVDEAGSAYVAGKTAGAYPTTEGSYCRDHQGTSSTTDVLVTKLSADGASLVFSTMIGADANDEPAAIRVGPDHRVAVGGVTDAPTSGAYPVTSGAFKTTVGGGEDGFVTVLNASGSALVFSTLFGGTGKDVVNGLAFAGDGGVVFAGTTSSDVASTPGAFDTTYNGGEDGFVAKLTATGDALAFFTYLGGSRLDQCAALALDSAGDIYLTGRTASAEFPKTDGAYLTPTGPGHAFVLKMTANGSAVVYSALIGSASFMAPTALAVDARNRVWFVGMVLGSGLPVTVDALQSACGGSFDGFIARLSADGSALEYSSYLGGASTDVVGSIAADGADAYYLCGMTVDGITTTPGAYRSVGAGVDGFLIKMLDTVPTTLTMDGATATAGSRTTLRARLTNPAGAGVSGRRVEFQIGAGPWVPAEILTSAIGYATLTITAPPTGGYNVGVRFQAVAPYLASDATGSLTTTDLAATTTTVSRAEASVGDGVRLAAYLRAPAGSTTVGGGIAGKGVEFRLDRGPWTAASGLTDATGKAELAVTALEGGTHDIEARFTGDATYAASNGFSTFTVAAKRNVYVYTINRSGKAGTAGMLIAYFYWYQKNGTLTPISGKSLRFQCAGVSLDSTATTDASGKATVSVTPASAGSYPFTVGFTADAEYNAGTGAGTLTVQP